MCSHPHLQQNNLSQKNSTLRNLSATLLSDLQLLCCFWLFPCSRSPLLCPQHKALSPHSPTQGPHPACPVPGVILSPCTPMPQPRPLLWLPQTRPGPSPPEPALPVPVLPSPPRGQGCTPVQTPLSPVPKPFPPTPNWASSPLAHTCHPQPGQSPSPVPISLSATEWGQPPLPTYRRTGSVPVLPVQTPTCGAALPRAGSRFPLSTTEGFSPQPGAAPRPEPEAASPTPTGAGPPNQGPLPPPGRGLSPRNRGLLPLNQGLFAPPPGGFSLRPNRRLCSCRRGLLARKRGLLPRTGGCFPP